MGDDESPDKVIREREFRLPSGIDIGNLDVSQNVDDSKKAQKQDDAIGDLFCLLYTSPSPRDED